MEKAGLQKKECEILKTDAKCINLLVVSVVFGSGGSSAWQSFRVG